LVAHLAEWLSCADEFFMGEAHLIREALGRGDLDLLRAAARICIRKHAKAWLEGEYFGYSAREAAEQFTIDIKDPSWLAEHPSYVSPKGNTPDTASDVWGFRYDFKAFRTLVAKFNKRAIAERDLDDMTLTMVLDELIQDAERADVLPGTRRR
jgi:hypothetical protein